MEQFAQFTQCMGLVMGVTAIGNSAFNVLVLKEYPRIKSSLPDFELMKSAVFVMLHLFFGGIALVLLILPSDASTAISFGFPSRFLWVLFAFAVGQISNGQRIAVTQALGLLRESVKITVFINMASLAAMLCAIVTFPSRADILIGAVAIVFFIQYVFFVKKDLFDFISLLRDRRRSALPLMVRVISNRLLHISGLSLVAAIVGQYSINLLRAKIYYQYGAELSAGFNASFSLATLIFGLSSTLIWRDYLPNIGDLEKAAKMRLKIVLVAVGLLAASYACAPYFLFIAFSTKIMSFGYLFKVILLCLFYDVLRQLNTAKLLADSYRIRYLSVVILVGAGIALLARFLRENEREIWLSCLLGVYFAAWLYSELIVGRDVWRGAFSKILPLALPALVFWVLKYI